MNLDYNTAIVATVTMIVENNAGCVARKLRAEGYPTRDRIPDSTLESTLFKLYLTVPDLFFKIMKACDWNQGNNNWTNNTQHRQQILSAVEKYTQKQVDKTNFWNITMDYLQSQQKEN